MTYPNTIVLRTGGSNWRSYVPLFDIDYTNHQPWNPDNQFVNVYSAPSNEIAMQFSYFAGYWLTRTNSPANTRLSVSVYSSGGTFTFYSTTAYPITHIKGNYTARGSTYYDLTLQEDSIANGLRDLRAYSFTVNAGTDVIQSSKVDVPGFPLYFLQTNTPWFVSARFKLSTSSVAVWKPIIGSAYTTVQQSGFWGIWLNNPNDYVHWRNSETNLTIQYIKPEKDKWYDIVVSYNPSNKRNLRFTLLNKDVSGNITSNSYVEQSNEDFKVKGILGNVTSGGWEKNSYEYFPGTIQSVFIGTMPIKTSLIQLLTLNKGYTNLIVPQSFSIDCSIILGDFMDVIDLSKAQATLTSNETDVTITRGTQQNWTVYKSTMGKFILTYTFTDNALNDDSAYPPIITSASVEVTQIAPTITFNNFSQTYSPGGTFSIAATSNSGGTFSYSIDTIVEVEGLTNVISISGTTVTILKAGIALITASQAAYGDYLAATKTATITIDKATPTITFNGFSRTYSPGGTFSIPAATSDSDGTFSYSVIKGTENISISGTTVTILRAGTAYIRAFQSSSINYTEGETVVEVTINKATPTITFNDFSRTYAPGGTFSIPAATSDSDGTFSYSVTSGTDVIEIIYGQTLYTVKAGTATIRAYQSSSTNYTEGEKTITVTINKSYPTITFNNFSQTYSPGGTFSIPVPSSNSNGTFSYSVLYRYFEGTDATNFVSNWNDTKIFTMTEFGELGPATAHGYSTGPVNFTLTLPLDTHSRIRYRVKWHLVDSLDNEVNRMYIGNGSTETEVLTFTKAFDDKPNVSFSAGQLSATWSGPKTYSYRPWATSTSRATVNGYLDIDSGWVEHTSSTLTVKHLMGANENQTNEAMYLTHVEVETFTSGTDVISISGTTVTILKTGTSTIRAFQSSSTNYTEGETLVSVTINKAIPTITFNGFSRTYAPGGTFSIPAATSNSDSIFSYSVNSGTDFISISGTTVTILKAGTASIRAFQSSTTNYTEGETVVSVTIDRAIDTLTTSQSIFYKKFINGAIILFNVISSNAGIVSRIHESNNTSVVSIPSSSSPSATIVGPGKTTIKVTQPQTTNYQEVTNNNLITIVVIGKDRNYENENMAAIDLSSTNLENSIFSNCILTGANLFGAIINSNTNLSSSTLTSVKSGRITGNTTKLPSGFKII